MKTGNDDGDGRRDVDKVALADMHAAIYCRVIYQITSSYGNSSYLVCKLHSIVSWEGINTSPTHTTPPMRALNNKSHLVFYSQ